MAYDVYIDKTFHLKFTVHANDQESAERIAKQEAGLRIFHDESPIITVVNVEGQP